MFKKSTPSSQANLFKTRLVSLVDPKHELIILSSELNWDSIESGLAKYYSSNQGRPCKPLRLMSGLLLLKQVFNLSDQQVVEQFVQNPYYQYFCGNTFFEWSLPCDPSELTKFRNRIGSEGVNLIFKSSVELNDKDCQVKEIVVDTTVQEKNITFPTDGKLAKKVIEKLWTIARQERVKLRQSYRRVVKELMKNQQFGHHPKRKKLAKKALKKLRTIAGRLIRDVERKLSEELKGKYQDVLKFYQQVISQTRTSKNKTYSLHEPHVACIAKGKNHKPYEFGSKVSFAVSKTGLIVGIVNYNTNIHDSKTLESTLQHVTKTTGKQVETVIADRGYRGRKKINQTEIVIPNNGKGKTAYQKRKARKRFRKRAGIEPIIGHIKHDHRLIRNYLKGEIGDQINALLAGTAFNIKKKLNNIRKELLLLIYFLFLPRLPDSGIDRNKV